jgi:hypothetical protein
MHGLRSGTVNEMSKSPAFRLELTQSFGRGHLTQHFVVSRPGGQFDKTTDELNVYSREELQELIDLLQSGIDRTVPA